MADALALYRAVMGEAWEDEGRRARAARDAAGARQGRGRDGRPGRSRGWTGGPGGRTAAPWGQPWGRPCPRNLMRAAGGSQAAVFKRIRSGGCKTPRALRDQLSYVNDKALYVTSPLLADRMEGAILSPQEKMAVVDAFVARWGGETKLGHTSHMLLSFPLDVPVEAVREIAVEWAERLFESGHYGDTWDYVLAVHDDRAHKHAHVVLNNRGRDQGTWFSCWREGAMSPQHLREVQAEIAAEHGYALEATSRLERGLVTRPAGLEEVYAARVEGRAREEPEDGVVQTAEARRAVVAFAREQRALGNLLERSRHETLARAIRVMAECLESGEAWEAQMAGTTLGAVALDEIRTVGDAMAYAEARWDQLGAQAMALDPEDRARFEIRAAEVKGELAAFLSDPAREASWTAVLGETYPPGAELQGVAEALRREGLAGARPEAVEAALEAARDLGLDADEMAARLEAGGTRNHGLAQAWTDRDVDRILERDGLDPRAAGETEREAATERLDAAQARLREALLEAGAELREPALVIDLAAAREAREAGPGEGREEGAGMERGGPREAPPVPDLALDPEALREREQAEQRAYLAAHPELLPSPAEVYTLDADGQGRLREGGQAARVLGEMAEMGITGGEPDVQARLARAFTERHPDMPGHVARDLAITYAQTARFAAEEDARLLRETPALGTERSRGMGAEAEPVADRGAEPDLSPSSDLDLQALALRLRREDLADEEKEPVARALEAALHRHLGAAGMARLDEGDHEALAGVLPSIQDRMNITYERLDLKRELGLERGLERDMDDDMGL